MRTIIVLFILLGMTSPVFAQEFNRIEAPETIEEAKEFGKQLGDKIPGEMEKVFKEEVLPVWGKMLEWAEGIWNQTVVGWIDGIVANLVGLFNREVEKRGDQIKEEFRKETEELKEDLKDEAGKAVQSLWERFTSMLFQSGK